MSKARTRFEKNMAQETVELKPQPAQEKFLASSADIVIGGGAAGGGKSWALLFEALRHNDNPEFSAVIFRRTFPEITAPGGLWPESKKAYPLLGAKARETDLCWRFLSGAIVKFGHVQYEQDLRNWLGSQICFIGFDQLETFMEQQFWYLLSRNRSTCGVRPYVRATANPEPGWLADTLEWWIDQDTGYPIPERAGKLRWLVRHTDKTYWGDSKEEMRLRFGVEPKSMTFIPFGLEDNLILNRIDPSYRANLEALPHVEKMRLLHGNWLVSGEKGEWPAEYFHDIRFHTWPAPGDTICSVLACDPSKGKDIKEGDYCAYVLIRVKKDWSVWVDAWMNKWTTTDIVKIGLDLYKEYNPTGIVFETNQYQELLACDFNRLSIERGIYPRTWGIYHTEPKPIRIRRIGPFLAQRRLKIKDNSDGAKLLLRQLQQFGPKDPTIHDDGPDALDLGLCMAEYLVTGRCPGSNQVSGIS